MNSPTLSSAHVFDVTGSRVLVTGGASGIGLGIARALALNGARVVILDRDPGVLGDTSSLLGPECRVVEADVADRDSLPAVLEPILAELGAFDAVFVNAGIGGGPGFRAFGSSDEVAAGTIDGTLDQDWDAVFRVNIDGVRNTLRAVVPGMKNAGVGGSIVLTSSCAALINVPFVSTAYHASKAAVSHLARQLAVELVQRFFASTSLLNRVAEIDEMAGLALFLASDASSYVTGVEIPIDGGARLKVG